MTKEEMKNLGPGDIVKHKSIGIQYMVTDNYGDRVTAVKTVDITNSIEWDLACKSDLTRKDKNEQSN